MRMFFKYCENADMLIDAENMCGKEQLTDGTDLQEWLNRTPSHFGLDNGLYPGGAYAGAETNKQVIEKLKKNFGTDDRFMGALLSDAVDGFENCGDHDCIPYFFFLHRYREYEIFQRFEEEEDDDEEDDYEEEGEEDDEEDDYE